jgi:hypothetical protein
MRADPLTLVSIFGKDVRYVVPMFQRPYVWNMTEHWEPLWDDVRGVTERLREADDEAARKGTQAQVPPHFLGAIVLDQMATTTGSIETRSVIDGQQRLTTLQVLLAAAQASAQAQGFEQQARLLGRLLWNDRDLVGDQPDMEFKMWPTNADREAFRAVMRGEQISSMSENASLKLATAMQYFRSVIDGWAEELGAECESYFVALTATLRQHLKVVAIDLDVEDNAQVIFETLNARGTPLQAADLVKNFLFQMADREKVSVDKLYEEYWAPFDRQLWRREIRQGRLVRPALDVFLGHWLAMVKETDTLVHQLFTVLKSYVHSSGLTGSQVIADLARSGRNYLEMQAYPRETLEGQFFYRQNLMDTTTTIPLLLYLFGLDSGVLPRARRQTALRAIESYLVRRMLCRFTTKGYNRIFLDLLGEVKKQPAEADEVVLRFLRRQQGESQFWPGDDLVRDRVAQTPLYTAVPRSRVRLVLEALERELRTGFSEETEPPSDLTIEHVLPQDWKAHWPLPSEAELEVATIARDRIKHTLGNLTLITGKLNTSASNGAWAVKKDALRDHSVLRLNWSLLKTDPADWDEDAIARRTSQLTDRLLEIWPGPESSSWDSMSASAPAQIEVQPVITVEDEPETEEELVRTLLETRVPNGPGRLLAEALLGELKSWSDVAMTVGTSARSKDGLSSYVMVRRLKSGVGTLVYAPPRENDVRLTFRLPREYVEGRDHAFARSVKDSSVYQVRMDLKSLDEIAEALDLARAAYENAS